MTDPADTPFYPKGMGIDPARFFGRLDHKRLFEEYLDGNHSRTPPHSCWVVSGRPGLGKTSFAIWAENEAESKAGESIVVARIKLDNPSRSEAESSSADVGTASYKKIISGYLNGLLPLRERQIKRTGRTSVRLAMVYAQKAGWAAYWLTQSVRFLKEKAPEFDASAGLLLRAVRGANRCLREPVGRSILIVDDVLPKHLVPVFRLAQGMEHIDAEGVPPMLLILICQPGWDRVMAQHWSEFPGLDRRLAQTLEITPFGPGEFHEYVIRELQSAGWTWDSKFLPALEAYSGSMPFLVNRLGNAAARQARSKGQAKLSKQHVVQAVVSDSQLGRTASSPFPGKYRIPKDQYSVTALRALSSNVGISSEPVYSETVLEGMTEERWLDIMRTATGSTDAAREACSSLWALLKEIGYVRRIVGSEKYGFASEALRVTMTQVVD
jgi:hypothetical protein